jgi:hypothetical protein
MRTYALHTGPCSFLDLRLSPWEVLLPFLLSLFCLSPWRLVLFLFHRWCLFLGGLPCLSSSACCRPAPGGDVRKARGGTQGVARSAQIRRRASGPERAGTRASACGAGGPRDGAPAAGWCGASGSGRSGDAGQARARRGAGCAVLARWASGRWATDGAERERAGAAGRGLGSSAGAVVGTAH